MFLIYKINVTKPDGVDFYETRILTKSIDEIRQKIRHRLEYIGTRVFIDIRYVMHTEVAESFEIKHIERTSNSGTIGLNYITKDI